MPSARSSLGRCNEIQTGGPDCNAAYQAGQEYLCILAGLRHQQIAPGAGGSYPYECKRLFAAAEHAIVNDVIGRAIAVHIGGTRIAGPVVLVDDGFAKPARAALLIELLCVSGHGAGQISEGIFGLRRKFPPASKPLQAHSKFWSWEHLTPE